MKKPLVFSLLILSLIAGVTAHACMECYPAFVLHNPYGWSCVITTIDYDCQVCTVVPDPCGPDGTIQKRPFVNHW